ncbi:hypothetical protein [Bacillus pretiosus]|mgnify:CR=1 FL=1
MTIIVVAANVAQAKEYWKAIKEKYQEDKRHHVRFISNREGSWDGIHWRNLIVILCGNYWENKFYKSDLYNMYQKFGVRIVYERL